MQKQEKSVRFADEDDKEEKAPPVLPKIELSATDADSLRLARLRKKQGIFFNLPADWEPPVWDPENDPNFKLDEIVAIFGARRTGKSTLAQEVLLKRRRLYPIIYCMTNTGNNGAWQQILPEDKVIDGVDVELLKEIIKLNDARCDAYKETKKGNPVVPVIVEDPMSDKKTVRSAEEVARVVFDGRHHGVAMWILSQDFTIFTPGERSSVDRFVLFASSDPRMMELIERSWGTRVLQYYVDVTSQPDWVLVIDNKSRTPVDQKLFKYKADKEWLDKAIHKNLVLGNRKMWDGIDIKEQKKKWRILELGAPATLAGNFNTSVDEVDEDWLEGGSDEKEKSVDFGILGGGVKEREKKKDKKEKGEEDADEGNLFSLEPSCVLL